MARRLRTHLACYRAICRDPRTPLLARLLLWLAFAYLMLPFDLIPDFIPVIGHLDDAILVPALILLALYLVPAEVEDEYRARLPSRQT